MPGSDIAQVLGTVFKKTEEQAQELQEKFDKERSQDIEMYRSVLMNSDPLITPEQRHKAAEWIQKLRNIKKDKPFSRLAGFLNIMHGMKNKQAPGSQPMDEKLPTGQSSTQIQEQPQQGQPQPQQQAKPGIMGRIAGGAGRMIQGTLGSHPAELPPLDTSVFQGQNPMIVYRQQLKEAVPGITDEELNKAVEQKFGAVSKPGAFAKKGTVMGDKVPEGSQDMFGNPVDKSKPYDVLENAQGEKQFIPSKPPQDSETDRTSQQWVFNANTNQWQLMPVTSHSKTTHKTPATGSGMGKPSINGQGQRKPMQPPPNTQTPPISHPGATAGHSGSKTEGIIPARAFAPLQKQGNAINEARASLVGDDPKQPMGMVKDIDIFKNPESVKRVSEYIKYVNSQLEDQSKLGTGSGPFAAAEWYLGLPSTISNLQSQQLRQYSQGLDGGASDGPEHQFVADYYRLLGTWGGMRAATGASAAKWSFRNLISEMPTPGPVTSYEEAQKRIKNMANESNVVSKSNPMVPQIDVNGLFGQASPKLDPSTLKTLQKWGLHP